MNTTTLGCTWAGKFFLSSQDAEESVRSEVMSFAVDEDWQGMVDYADGYSGWDLSRRPFTADDAAVTIDKWMIIALEDDASIDASIRGAALVVRPFSKRGFILRKQGGVAYTDSDRVPSTKSASLQSVGSIKEPNIAIKSFPNGLDTKWQLGETTNGQMGFFYNGACQFVLYPEGGGWTKQHPELKTLEGGYEENGKYYTSSAGPALNVESTLGAFLMLGTENWLLQQSLDGDLQWIDYSSDDGVARLATKIGNGKFYSGDPANGYLKDQALPDDLWDVFQNVINGLFEDFLDLANESWDFIVDIAISSWEWVVAAVDEAWDWMEGAASDAWDWTVDAYNTIIGFIDDLFGATASGIALYTTAETSMGTDTATQLATMVSTTQIVAAVEEVSNEISDWFC